MLHRSLPITCALLFALFLSACERHTRPLAGIKAPEGSPKYTVEPSAVTGR